MQIARFNIPTLDMNIHGYGHSIPIPYISNDWIVTVFISRETIITNNLHVLKLTKYITKHKEFIIPTII